MWRLKWKWIVCWGRLTGNPLYGCNAGSSWWRATGNGQSGSWHHIQGRCKETCAGGFAGVTESYTDLGEASGRWCMFSIGSKRRWGGTPKHQLYFITLQRIWEVTMALRCLSTLNIQFKVGVKFYKCSNIWLENKITLCNIQAVLYSMS